MGFIVNGSEYHGKENMEIVLRPRFFGTKPAEMGIRVVDARGASSVKLTFFGRIAKILMPYTSGFQGGTLAEKLQKKLVLAEFKAEASYDKHDYKDMILEQLVNKGGVAQNDIEGTDVMDAERTVFMDAVEGDVFANFWLGDTTKTHVSAGTYPNGVAYAAGDPDKYYNSIDGVLKHIFDDVYQSFVSAQKLITGWNQVTYPVLYLKYTGTDTIKAYSSAAARTAGTAGAVLFTFPASSLGTYPAEVAVTAANASGFGGKIILEKELKLVNLTFELHAAKHNFITKVDLADTLTSDDAETAMLAMLRNAPPELKALKASGSLRFYATDSVIYNYEDSLRDGVTDSARTAKIDGIDRLLIDGVPIIPMNIDALIGNDFAETYPKDIIVLTTPQNICLVINGSSNFSETRFWFNPDENENRQRTQFEMGANYILPELVVAAYKAPAYTIDA